jgi:phage terminase large subunit
VSTRSRPIVLDVTDVTDTPAPYLSTERTKQAELKRSKAPAPKELMLELPTRPRAADPNRKLLSDEEKAFASAPDHLSHVVVSRLCDELVRGLAENLAPYEQYKKDILGFSRNVLGIVPWDLCEGMPADVATQVKFLLAIQDNDWIAVCAGQKTSKTSSLVIAALWWVYTQKNAKAWITAPSYESVKTIFWAELRKVVGGSFKPGFKPHLPGKLSLVPDGGLELGPGWGVYGFATDKAERVQGKSGARQLVLVDEASGYPEHLFPPLIGNLGGGGKLVLTSNGTQLAGTFYDAFNTKRHLYKTLTFDSRQTPNFYGGNIPGLATPAWEATVRDLWNGEGNALYDVRVCGKFPEQDSSLVVTLAAVLAAHRRWDKTPDSHPVRFGLDVSRSGDDITVLKCLRGQRLHHLGELRPSKGKPLSGEMVASWVKGLIQQNAQEGDPEKSVINVDANGIGVSAYDELSKDEDVIAIGVMTGESAEERTRIAPDMTAKDAFFNLRSQIAFGFADWLRDGGALDPKDQKLAADLVVAHYGFDRKGRRQVEGKDEIKKRLSGRSPDHADAAMLAVYVGALREVYQSIRGPARRATGWTFT